MSELCTRPAWWYIAQGRIVVSEASIPHDKTLMICISLGQIRTNSMVHKVLAPKILLHCRICLSSQDHPRMHTSIDSYGIYICDDLKGEKKEFWVCYRGTGVRCLPHQPPSVGAHAPCTPCSASANADQALLVLSSQRLVLAVACQRALEWWTRGMTY